MILETERLILRPWEESDAEDLFQYATSSTDILCMIFQAIKWF